MCGPWTDASWPYGDDRRYSDNIINNCKMTFQRHVLRVRLLVISLLWVVCADIACKLTLNKLTRCENSRPWYVFVPWMERAYMKTSVHITSTRAYLSCWCALVCFCRAMLCISAVYAVMRCLCVCPSRSWILSKRINIFKIFHNREPHHSSFSVTNVIAIFRQGPA